MPDDAPQLRAACARFIADHLTFGGARYAFAISVDGDAVGTVGISAVDPVHQAAWAACWLAAGHRGRGLAVRGLVTVSAWATEHLAVFRLELGHRTNNPASCRVATRAGYLAEGLERAKLRYGTDRYDVETHARLATDPAPRVTPLPPVLTGPSPLV